MILPPSNTESLFHTLKENTIVKTITTYLQVQLVEVLVDKGDETLLDNLQLVGRVIKQGVESVTFTSHTNVLKNPKCKN